MVKLSKAQIKAFNNGETNINDLADVLLEKYPVKEIAKALVEALATEDVAPVKTAPAAAPVKEPKPKKITVTQQELDDIIGIFKVKGTDGRGRKPKKEEIQ